MAEFNCQFKPIGDYTITWTVNVSSGINDGKSGITTTLENRMLHLICFETFYNSVVQCGIYNFVNFSAPTLYGEVFFVQIQGK